MSETTNQTESAQHEDHEGLYWKIGGLLFALTIATVLVSRVHFPAPFGLLIGLAIAAFKAALVAAIFMHLKWEKKMIGNLLLMTGFFCLFLFAIPILDQILNAPISYQSENPAVLDTGSAGH